MPVALPVAYLRPVVRPRQPSAWLALCILLAVFSLTLGVRYPLDCDEMVGLEVTPGL